MDSTIGVPIIASSAMARHKPRNHKRLYNRRDEMMKLLAEEHARANDNKPTSASETHNLDRIRCLAEARG